MVVAAVERDLEEVWSQGNLDVIDELDAEDCTIYGPEAGEAVHGCEAMKEAVGKARAVRHTWSGTNEGPLSNGWPATGERVTVSGLGLARFEGDKFAELHFYSDFESTMDQLGLVPESM